MDSVVRTKCILCVRISAFTCIQKKLLENKAFSPYKAPVPYTSIGLSLFFKPEQ